MKKNFITKKRIIIFITTIIIFFFISSFYASLVNHTQITAVKKTVTKENITSEVITSGQLKPFKQTTVGAQVTGEIKALHVNIGDYVKKGQLIAELDPTVQQNNLEKAKNNLVAVQSELNTLQKKLSVTKSDLESYTILYQKGAASKTDYNRIKTQYKELYENAIKAKAQIHQAKLDVDNMTKNLSYTKITAPMDGIIVSLPVEVGQTLTAGYNTPLVATIAEMNKMTIKAQISEADIYNIKPGQKATFSIMGDSNKKYEAVVDIVHPAPTYVSDNGNTTSSTYYYTTLNVNQTDKKFRINMTVTVTIYTDEKLNIIAVPNTAIIEKDNKHFVQLIDKNHRLIEHEIKTGFTNGTLTEVLAGLKEGDTIIEQSIKKE